MDASTLRENVIAMRDEIVTTLQTLVRTPSITGDEAEVGKFVARFCESLGFEVQVVEAEPGRPNIIATWRGTEPGPTLLLNDHLDIVPPGPLEHWTYPPFNADIDNGRVYGRGTIDTKSGLTTILMAAKAARQLELPIRGELVLIFSCDEEVGGGKGMQHLANNGYVNADMAVVAEPTSMQVEIGTKGRLHLEITTRGTATHGARPWLGHNAIDDMADVIVELRSLAEEIQSDASSLFGNRSLCVGTIEGGVIPNMVPSKCIAGLDHRILPGDDPDAAESRIWDILEELTRRKSGFDASLERLLWWPGYAMNEDDPVVRLASDAFHKVTGAPPTIAGKDAGTDASWINVLAGVPVVMFSPGDGMQAMNADESVDIEDLVTATEVMGQIVYDALVSDEGSRYGTTR